MKTKTSAILVVFYFCLFLPALAQDSLGFSNKKEAKNLVANGVKEGKWIEYIGKWGLVLAGTSKETISQALGYRLTIYKAGKPFQIAREYDNKGKLNVTTPYDSIGRKDGIEKRFYEDGELFSEMPYSNDTAVGISKTYRDKGGISTESPYVKGRLNGIEKQYYESGKLKSEIPFVDGLKNGVEKEYFENGVLSLEIPYTDNSKNGIEKEYTKSGKLKRETTYTINEMGATKNYDENGNEIH